MDVLMNVMQRPTTQECKRKECVHKNNAYELIESSVIS